MPADRPASGAGFEYPAESGQESVKLPSTADLAATIL